MEVPRLALAEEGQAAIQPRHPARESARRELLGQEVPVRIVDLGDVKEVERLA